MEVPFRWGSKLTGLISKRLKIERICLQVNRNLASKSTLQSFRKEIKNDGNVRMTIRDD